MILLRHVRSKDDSCDEYWCYNPVLSFMLAEYADVVQVDVGGIADKVVALLGGHVDIIVGPYGNVKPYVDSGDFNILGVCGKERAALYPEVPHA